MAIRTKASRRGSGTQAPQFDFDESVLSDLAVGDPTSFGSAGFEGVAYADVVREAWELRVGDTVEACRFDGLAVGTWTLRGAHLVESVIAGADIPARLRRAQRLARRRGARQQVRILRGVRRVVARHPIHPLQARLRQPARRGAARRRVRRLHHRRDRPDGCRGPPRRLRSHPHRHAERQRRAAHRRRSAGSRHRSGRRHGGAARSDDLRRAAAAHGARARRPRRHPSSSG